MNVCILMGSPRLKGNTAEACKPLVGQLRSLGARVRYIPLSQLDIHPCRGCYACQQVDAPEYGCVQSDGMEGLVRDVSQCELLILATPIYTWYCTGEMKAVLDRFYGMNKYYGRGTGSLWAGKALAVLATCGYEPRDGAGPFVQGMERLCRHSGLRFLGWHAVRDEADLASFQTPEAVEGIRAFARGLLSGEAPER